MKQVETTIDAPILDVTSIPKMFWEPFVDPLSRTYWMGLLLMLPIAAVFYMVQKPNWNRNNFLNVTKTSSFWLDIQLLIAKQITSLMIGTPIFLSSWYIATKGVRWLDGFWGIPSVPDISKEWIVFLYSVVLFVLWDCSRFIVHICMHKIPFLWSFHQVHHSAEILTPLTFHRIHPVESWIYSIRSALVTGFVAGIFYWLFRQSLTPYSIFGVPAFGFLLNVIFGNIRHSHIYLRFPRWIESWCFLSPAQHQQHHSIDKEHHDKNYGTWLSIWDRLFGTLLISEQKPSGYGLQTPNHNNNLISAYLKPFLSLFPIVFCFISVPVFADPNSTTDDSQSDDTEETSQSPEESPIENTENTDHTENTDKNSFGTEMIVYSDDQKLRVAGSAHKVDEEVLERFELDNIEQVIEQIPGMTTRNEDGFGLRPNIGIRGANSDRSAKITLMEDGILLAPAPYAAPAAYYFPMPTRVTGVEIFKGPAATRFGPHTIGGALNLQTRDIPSQQSTYIDLAGGLRSTYKGHIWFSQNRGRFSHLFEIVHLQSDGFKEIDGGGDTGFDRSELMWKGKIATKTGYTQLKLGYAREHSLETYLGLQIDDFYENPYRRYISSAMGDMSWNRTQMEWSWLVHPSSNWTIHSAVYHHFLDRSWTKLNGFRDGTDLHQLLQSPSTGQSAVYLSILRGEEDSLDSDQFLQIGTNHRVFHSFGAQSKLQRKSYGERYESTFEMGVRYHGDHVVRIHTEDPYMIQNGVLLRSDLETETLLDSTARANALAVHLHEDISFSKIHVFPGLRLEMVQGQRKDPYAATQDSIVRTTLLPGFAMLLNVGDWTDAFWGIHRGFSPVAPGQPQEVRPELSWNYEGGFRWNLGKNTLEFVGFFNDYENILGQCSFSGGCNGDTIDQQYNGGEVWIFGVENSIGTNLPIRENLTIPFSMSYTWNQSVFQSDFYSNFPQFGSVSYGDMLPYLPQHQGSLSIGLQKNNIFDVGLIGTYRSKMLDMAGIFDDDGIQIPDIFLMNAAINVNITETYRIYLSGTNLLNNTSLTSLRPFGARPVAPRQIMVGIKKD